MAGIIINMSKVKQVLRLHAQGLSNRKIAGDLGLYKGIVNSYVRKIKEDEYRIEELLALEEPVLESKLFAGNPAYKQDRFEEFKGMISYREEELKKTACDTLSTLGGIHGKPSGWLRVCRYALDNDILTCQSIKRVSEYQTSVN